MPTNHNVCRFPAKLLHDPLEAGVLAYLGGGVDILYWEQRPQPEEQYFGESCHQLKYNDEMMLVSAHVFTWVWVTITLTQSDLASISWRHLLAKASQPSVWPSMSPLSVIQSSRLCRPSRPAPSRPPTLFPANVSCNLQDSETEGQPATNAVLFQCLLQSTVKSNGNVKKLRILCFGMGNLRI